MSATTWCIIILLAQIRYSSLTYRMAGNFQLNQLWVGIWHTQNFVEKTFAGGSQTAKFMNVFTLEGIPLYGNFCGIVPIAHLSHDSFHTDTDM